MHLAWWVSVVRSRRQHNHVQKIHFPWTGSRHSTLAASYHFSYQSTNKTFTYKCSSGNLLSYFHYPTLQCFLSSIYKHPYTSMHTHTAHSNAHAHFKGLQMAMNVVCSINCVACIHMESNQLTSVCSCPSILILRSLLCQVHSSIGENWSTLDSTYIYTQIDLFTSDRKPRSYSVCLMSFTFFWICIQLFIQTIQMPLLSVK